MVYRKKVMKFTQIFFPRRKTVFFPVKKGGFNATAFRATGCKQQKLAINRMASVFKNENHLRFRIFIFYAILCVKLSPACI